ncbi:SMI1/KNR4 family protein [Micromonospora fluostatini]|uniref:SMI1/KNR4 family protein n=1 Tax=Micromonospora sp. JCM 30529 TaxID=3421643 RepID=UPI003D186ABB
MENDPRALPPPLAESHRLEFDFDDGAGVDFEPYPQFMDAGETTDWWRAWTGNPDADGAGFRVFGQDGTGGLAAFWLVRAGEPLDRQPVVFLGSEGEKAVVAQDLGGYLWLLAAGVGPLEATMYLGADAGDGTDDGDGYAARPDARRVEIAERWAPASRRPAAEIVAAARAEFPGFGELVDSMCR